MPQCGPVRLATSPPACDAATVVLRGPVWSGLVQQQSGAKQLGYLRAWLRLKKPSRDSCRLHEAIAQWNRRPANLSFDRRSASYNRWPRRCDGFRACSIAWACKPAQRLDRRTPSCKRSAAQADANAVARAPRTVRARSVRSDSTKVAVPPPGAGRATRVAGAACNAHLRCTFVCSDAVRAAIRPSTVHAEVQTLCSNTHWPIPPHS